MKKIVFLLVAFFALLTANSQVLDFGCGSGICYKNNEIPIENPDDFTGRVDLDPDPKLTGQTHRYFVAGPNGKTPVPDIGIFYNWHSLVIKTKSGQVIEKFDDRPQGGKRRQSRYYINIYNDGKVIRYLIESPEYIDNFLRKRFPG